MMRTLIYKYSYIDINIEVLNSSYTHYCSWKTFVFILSISEVARIDDIGAKGASLYNMRVWGLCTQRGPGAEQLIFLMVIFLMQGASKNVALVQLERYGRGYFLSTHPECNMITTCSVKCN